MLPLLTTAFGRLVTRSLTRTAPLQGTWPRHHAGGNSAGDTARNAIADVRYRAGTDKRVVWTRCGGLWETPDRPGQPPGSDRKPHGNYRLGDHPQARVVVAGVSAYELVVLIDGD